MVNKVNSKSELIINGNILKALLSLIIPMSIGMFALLVINLVDAYYIGKLGVLELSAISYAFPVLFTLMSFNIGIAIGISATVSKYIGQGDLYKAKKTVSNVMVLIFLLMVLLSIVSFHLNNYIFSLLGANWETLILINEYMSIWYIGSPFFACLVIGNSVLRANGDSIKPSSIIIITSLTNAVLDPIFIFGWGPLNAMSIQGAAIALSLIHI